MNKITVIGTGYVGLVSGAGLADFGNQVICADIDEEKIHLLKNGKIPIFEPGLKEVVDRNVKNGRLSFTADVEKSIQDSEVIFIAVGTPEGKDGSADLTAVFTVAELIADNLNILQEVYRPLYIHETPIIHTNVPTAEMIKYASNAFLALKISYINEIANLCEAVGADVHIVAKAMGTDGRISPKFLHPGPGFGGSCFPKDTKALVTLAESLGVPINTVSTAIATNENQKNRMVKKLFNLLDNEIAGKNIAILGLSFKHLTDDIRESASIEMIEQILNNGGIVKAYDPEAMGSMKKLFPGIQYCIDWQSAVKDADAIALMTEWHEFRGLDLVEIKSLMKTPILLDTRNLLSMEKLIELGYKFDNVGRKIIK